MSSNGLICLVHDRRWTPTYQFFFNQMCEKTTFPKRDGRTFSRMICVCHAPSPKFADYFGNLRGMETAYEEVYKTLTTGGWEDVQLIIKPLTKNISEKLSSELQLIKFVYYFKNCKDGDISSLFYGHKLPGPSPSPVSSGSLFRSTVSPSVSAITPGSAIGTRSATLAKPPATASVGPSPSLKTGNQAPINRNYRVKKIAKSDRLETCYFHGEKNRFMFQCVLNGLQKRNGFLMKFKQAMTQLVCTCDKKPDKSDFYTDDSKLKADIRCFILWLDPTRSESMNALRPLHEHLKELENGSVPDDLIPLIYYFRQVETKSYTELVDMDKAIQEAKKK